MKSKHQLFIGGRVGVARTLAPARTPALAGGARECRCRDHKLPSNKIYYEMFGLDTSRQKHAGLLDQRIAL
jgi:hypothetical protein